MNLASGSALGASGTNVALDNGNLTTRNQSGSVAIVKSGGLTFSSGSQLYMDDQGNTANSASITFGSLTRNGNGTLQINPNNNGTFRPSQDLFSTVAPTVTSGIVAPYYRNTNGNFLTYGSGFANATYTVGGRQRTTSMAPPATNSSIPP